MLAEAYTGPFVGSSDMHGSSIGLKGMAVTSKVIAASAIDVLMDPSIIERAQAEFKEKTKGFVYKSAIPKEQKPPLPQ